MGRREGPLPLTAPRVVLLVGDAARQRDRLIAEGHDARIATADVELGVAPGSCDAVIARDVLCRDPWDRWALQRMHRALKPGGRLDLDEPNRLDLATPSGLLYVAGRGLREAGRAAQRRLGAPAPAQPSLAGRRPSPVALGAMLERLRFTDIVVSPDRAPGWGRALPPAFAARLKVTARALPSLAGYAGDWPDPAIHRRAYATDQAHLLAVRERWRRAHGDPAAIVRFDAAAHAGRTALVLAPHPDDEVIGAGGAILGLVAAGARVVVVQATDGSAGAALAGLPDAERRAVRLREAAAVAERMGVAAVEWWREDNAHFAQTPGNVERLRALLERERPALVFVPFPTDTHPDHVTLARILAAALAPGGASGAPPDALVLGYEVWSVVPPTHVHDVTPLMKQIESLFFHYDQAMRIDDFVHFCADRALDHADRLEGRAAYLEAFHAVAAADFPGLVAKAEALR